MSTIYTSDALNNLSSLYYSGQGVDFYIKCGDREFKVHRCFIAQQQGFFKGLLQQGQGQFAEASMNTVDLTDTGYHPCLIEALIEHTYGIEPEYSPKMAQFYLNEASFWARAFAVGNYFQVPGFQEIAKTRFRDLAGLTKDSTLDKEALQETEESDDEFMDEDEGEAEDLDKDNDHNVSGLAIDTDTSTWHRHLSNVQLIIAAAPDVYNATPDSVRDLRDIVLRLCAIHFDDVLSKKKILQDMMTTVPSLAAELIKAIIDFKKKVGQVDSTWRCQRLACDFVYVMNVADWESSREICVPCPMCGENSAEIDVAFRGLSIHWASDAARKEWSGKKTMAE